MPLDSEDLFHLAAEVTQGVKPEDSTLPNTPEVRHARSVLETEVAAIKAKGLVPDVPSEWPQPA